MSAQIESERFIVVAHNNLSYNCQTHVGDGEYWPHYQLEQQSNGTGIQFDLDYDEVECEAEDEKIVVSSPGLSIPAWCGDCEVVWQLLKKENDHATSYQEVGLISLADENSLNAWYQWYDSGFSSDNPESETA
jgi:hypothetical protein